MGCSGGLYSCQVSADGALSLKARLGSLTDVQQILVLPDVQHVVCIAGQYFPTYSTCIVGARLVLSDVQHVHNRLVLSDVYCRSVLSDVQHVVCIAGQYFPTYSTCIAGARLVLSDVQHVHNRLVLSDVYCGSVLPDVQRVYRRPILPDVHNVACIAGRSCIVCRWMLMLSSRKRRDDRCYGSFRSLEAPNVVVSMCSLVWCEHVCVCTSRLIA